MIDAFDAITHRLAGVEAFVATWFYLGYQVDPAGVRFQIRGKKRAAQVLVIDPETQKRAWIDAKPGELIMRIREP